MFDFVHKRKRVVQGVLALITLPFAFFGIDYYFKDSGRATEVAHVGGDRITEAEFANTLSEQRERLRQQQGARYDPTVFDKPDVRYSVLQQLIGQRLIDDQARRNRFSVSDDQLAQFIGNIPDFQEDGKFSHVKYESLLMTQNLTPQAFEQRARQQLTIAPMEEPILAGNIVAKSNIERYLALLEQKRDAALATIPVDAYLKDAKVDDAAVKAFYDANASIFQIPEEVSIEYVALNPDALFGRISVDAAEIKKQYDDNIKQYSKPEERQASHILIAVKKDASDDEKAAAKQKAQALLDQARKTPARFADIARQNSQDPGSAGQGGDLGFIARDGSMVKPFEDAVFGAKQGDIVGPVQTDFGWHVIKVSAIKPAKTQSLDEVSKQLEQDLKRQKATKKFVEDAEQFQNLVYEQADSLEPVAKALGLQVQKTPLLTRPQLLALSQNSEKFVQAVFSPDSLQAKRNTEAIEVGTNAIMAGRVIEYKAASPRAFDQVKADIRRELERRAAVEAAQRAGKEKLALLQQGKDAGLVFGKPITLSRNQPMPGFPADAMTRIFQADESKLPAYVGTEGVQGYTIYRVERVIAGAPPDPAKLSVFVTRLGDQIGRELFAANIASLKGKTDVKINQSNLEKRADDSRIPDPVQAPPAGGSKRGGF